MSEIKFDLISEVDVTSLQEFQQAARTLSRNFTPRSVVALNGPLGAGKTEFVRTLCLDRGFQDVASPTFAIHHRYQGLALSIDHLDLYRLESEDELETTGFWDFFSSQEGLIFIEWSERMNLANIPYDWDLFVIEIQRKSEFSRQVSLFKRN